MMWLFNCFKSLQNYSCWLIYNQLLFVYLYYHLASCSLQEFGSLFFYPFWAPGFHLSFIILLQFVDCENTQITFVIEMKTNNLAPS